MSEIFFSVHYFFSFEGAPPPNSLLSFLLLVTVSQPGSIPGARGSRFVTSQGLCSSLLGMKHSMCVPGRPARQENALAPDGVYPGLHGTMCLRLFGKLGERAPAEWSMCCVNLVGNRENFWGHIVALVRQDNFLFKRRKLTENDLNMA